MAELNISERQAGDVTVLDMSGKITIGEGRLFGRQSVVCWKRARRRYS